MTTEEYISSGVLESYVMGELSDKEMQKVQCMALVHDDIRGHQSPRVDKGDIHTVQNIEENGFG